MHIPASSKQRRLLLISSSVKLRDVFANDASAICQGGWRSELRIKFIGDNNETPRERQVEIYTRDALRPRRIVLLSEQKEPSREYNLIFAHGYSPRSPDSTALFSCDGGVATVFAFRKHFYQAYPPGLAHRLAHRSGYHQLIRTEENARLHILRREGRITARSCPVRINPF